MRRWSRAGSALVLFSLASLGTAVRAQDDAGVPPGDAGPPAPVLVAPRLLEAPPVELPEGAEPLPEVAAVELSITVAADGTVSAAVVTGPLREDVDALVLEAARAMRFEPATRDGRPIPARIRFRYRIALPAPPPDAGVADAAAAAEEAPPAEADAGVPGADADAGVPGAEADAGAEPDPGESSSFSARALVERPEPGATTRITLRGVELTTVPGTFGDPLRVVQALPGVARSPFGIGFFVVRGTGFQNTGFMVDGFPIPILYHFGFGPSVIAPSFISRLNFYPGNYPVRFGRFSGGLISIESGSPEARSPIAELQIDLLRASGSVVVPFDGTRGVVAAAFRRSYYELLLPLFVQGLSIQFTDYQVRTEYRFDRHFSASLFVLGSDDSLDQSGAIGGAATSSGANSAIAINFQRVIGRLVWRLEGEDSIALGMTAGRDGQFFGSQAVGENRQHFGLETFITGLRLDGTFHPTPWLTTNAGLDLGGMTTRVDVTAPLPQGLGQYPRPVFDPQSVRLRSVAALGAPGAYGEAVLRFDPVEVSAGLRVELLRYGTAFQVAPDPRLVARWRVLPEWLLKVGTGLFTQAPVAIQTLSLGGNPGLGPQRAWQSSVGTEITLPWSLDLQINGFYSQMFDIARFAQTTTASMQRQFFVSDQQGRAYGLELLFRREVQDGLYFWLSYTWSRSERLNPGGEWQVFNQDQEHVLYLVGSGYVSGWRFGGRFTLATGRPIARIDHGIYDADSNSYDSVRSGIFDRLPVYTQLDVRIDRDFDIGPVRGTVYLDVMNVYYAQNAEGVLYQYDYQRSVPLPGVPILGTLGIRGSIQ